VKLGRKPTLTHWLTVEWLPRYAPELNDIEPVWHDLKAYHLAHQTLTDAAALDQAIHVAVTDLDRERTHDPLGEPRISVRKIAWEVLALCGLGIRSKRGTIFIHNGAPAGRWWSA